ncbi:MAG: alpha/beta fold hydrolase [bacterium]
MASRIMNLVRHFTRKPTVGMTPSDVVFQENKWKLLRYRSEQTSGLPILLVPSLINRHYVLDLKPGKSFVEYLVARGHDVFIIDWGTPGPEDRYLEFDDFAEAYLGRALRKTCKIAGVEQAHVLGYCLGGTLTTIHAAKHPEHIASLTNLAAPISFEDGGLLAAFSNIKTLDLEILNQAFGNVPWPLMQFGFHLLRPTMNLSKAVYVMDRSEDDEFLDGFFALETWGNDNVSFPGRAFVRYIQELYRENRLVKGEFALGGQLLDLASIEMPVLNIAFKHDNIVPVESAAILNDLISSTDKTLHRLGGGHVGAVVSTKAATGLWPLISDWWRERDPVSNVTRIAV